MCDFEHRERDDGCRVRSVLLFPLVLELFADLATCSSVTAVDIDPDALVVARENIASVEMEEHVEFIHAEIAPAGSKPTSEDVPVFDPKALGKKFDTVVMK